MAEEVLTSRCYLPSCVQVRAGAQTQTDDAIGDTQGAAHPLLHSVTHSASVFPGTLSLAQRGEVRCCFKRGHCGVGHEDSCGGDVSASRRRALPCWRSRGSVVELVMRGAPPGPLGMAAEPVVDSAWSAPCICCCDIVGASYIHTYILLLPSARRLSCCRRNLLHWAAGLPVCSLPAAGCNRITC